MKKIVYKVVNELNNSSDVNNSELKFVFNQKLLKIIFLIEKDYENIIFH